MEHYCWGCNFAEEFVYETYYEIIQYEIIHFYLKLVIGRNKEHLPLSHFNSQNPFRSCSNRFAAPLVTRCSSLQSFHWKFILKRALVPPFHVTISFAPSPSEGFRSPRGAAATIYNVSTELLQPTRTARGWWLYIALPLKKVLCCAFPEILHARLTTTESGGVPHKQTQNGFCFLLKTAKVVHCLSAIFFFFWRGALMYVTVIVYFGQAIFFFWFCQGKQEILGNTISWKTIWQA